MLMPGLAKFTEPFITMLATQLDKSGLPFPEFTFHMVRISEIVVGLTLLALAFYGKRLSAALRDKVFYGANGVVGIMMLVALYVHLHPDVPAEVLPFESKPPVLTVVYLILVATNIYLYTKKQAHTLQSAF